MTTHNKVKTRLGDLLIDKGLITEEQLHLAIQIQKTNQLQLGEILVNNGWVTKRQINRALRVQSKLRNAILTSILSFSPLVLIGGAADAFAAPKTVKESQLSPGKAFGKQKQTTDTSTTTDSSTTTDTSTATDSSTTTDTAATTDTSTTTDSSTTTDTAATTDTSTTTDSSTTTDTAATTDTSTTTDSSTTTDTAATTDTSTTTDSSTTTDTAATSDTSTTTDSSTTTDTAATTDTSTTTDSSTDVVTADHGATIHLSWDYPLERVDGSGLEVYEIDRFHVYQLNESGDYGEVHVVDGLETQLDIPGLQDGEYHFAVTVVDNDGLESDYSEVVTISVL